MNIEYISFFLQNSISRCHISKISRWKLQYCGSYIPLTAWGFGDGITRISIVSIKSVDQQKSWVGNISQNLGGRRICLFGIFVKSWTRSKSEVRLIIMNYTKTRWKYKTLFHIIWFGLCICISNQPILRPSNQPILSPPPTTQIYGKPKLYKSNTFCHSSFVLVAVKPFISDLTLRSIIKLLRCVPDCPEIQSFFWICHRELKKAFSVTMSHKRYFSKNRQAHTPYPSLKSTCIHTLSVA